MYKLLAAAVVVGSLLVTAPGASASTSTTTHCSATGILNPVLGTPSCTTPKIVCPANHTCFAGGVFEASAVVGLFNAGAIDTLFDLSGPLATGSCQATFSGCSGGTGIVSIHRIQNDPVSSLCRYNKGDPGVLVRISCWTTVTVQ
jgi:hypothetical protein